MRSSTICPVCLVYLYFWSDGDKTKVLHILDNCSTTILKAAENPIFLPSLFLISLYSYKYFYYKDRIYKSV